VFGPKAVKRFESDRKQATVNVAQRCRWVSITQNIIAAIWRI